MSHQDWDEVVLTKSAPFKGSKSKSKKQGEDQKKTATKPKRVRVDEQQEDFRTAKIGKSFSVALQQARLKKGWNQHQLAQQLNVRHTVINQYESGKAIPNPQLIAKMNRILGVKLPAINKPGKKKKKKSST
mmetsp:Transcript_6775/g.11130  ORF Transcript_6775/g.11130 Transcript_6775/m.11130 type:complete len:131 (-) Transcript_6775:210-602(-)